MQTLTSGVDTTIKGQGKERVNERGSKGRYQNPNTRGTLARQPQNERNNSCCEPLPAVHPAMWSDFLRKYRREIIRLQCDYNRQLAENTTTNCDEERAIHLTEQRQRNKEAGKQNMSPRATTRKGEGARKTEKRRAQKEKKKKQHQNRTCAKL